MLQVNVAMPWVKLQTAQNATAGSLAHTRTAPCRQHPRPTGPAAAARLPQSCPPPGRCARQGWQGPSEEPGWCRRPQKRSCWARRPPPQSLQLPTGRARWVARGVCQVNGWNDALSQAPAQTAIAACGQRQVRMRCKHVACPTHVGDDIVSHAAWTTQACNPPAACTGRACRWRHPVQRAGPGRGRRRHTPAPTPTPPAPARSGADPAARRATLIHHCSAGAHTVAPAFERTVPHPHTNPRVLLAAQPAHRGGRQQLALERGVLFHVHAVQRSSLLLHHARSVTGTGLKANGMANALPMCAAVAPLSSMATKRAFVTITDESPLP